MDLTRPGRAHPGHRCRRGRPQQYLYHPIWRAQRDQAKFDRILLVARRLPRLRRRVSADLAGRGLTRSRVLATTARLLDRGLFRIGGDEYAAGDDATYGWPRYARNTSGWSVAGWCSSTRPRAAWSVPTWSATRTCGGAAGATAAPGRPGPAAGLLDRARWRDVRSDDVNAYLREASGGEMTAKDFRTWHATVFAARMLAAAGPGGSATRRSARWPR